MSAIVKFIKTEPVLAGTIVSAVVTIAVALGIGQGEAGTIAAALQVLVGAIARSQVTPTVKLPAATAETAVTSNPMTFIIPSTETLPSPDSTGPSGTTRGLGTIPGVSTQPPTP